MWPVFDPCRFSWNFLIGPFLILLVFNLGILRYSRGFGVLNFMIFNTLWQSQRRNHIEIGLDRVKLELPEWLGQNIHGWSLVEMNVTFILLTLTYSRKKWKSISMCFILVRKIVLIVREVALILLHHKTRVVWMEMLISRSNNWSHLSLDVAFVMAFYSDSVLDLATIGCFFVLQEIRLDPR